MQRDPQFEEQEGLIVGRPYQPPEDKNFFERFSFKSLTFHVTLIEVIIFFLTIFHTVYLIAKYLDSPDEESDTYNFECVLYAWGSKHTPSIIYRFQYWRLVTPILLHGSLSHIIGNMVVQVYYGFMLEITHGWARVTAVYLLGGIGASLFSCIRFFYETSVGASGAIFALLGLELVYFITSFPKIETRRIVVFIVLAPLIFLSFIDAPPQVDIAGHLGGLVIGLILGFAFACADSRLKIVQTLQYLFYGLVLLVFVLCLVIIYENKLEDRQICEGMHVV